MGISCYGVLVADKIIREDNGKLGVIGIFSQLNFPSVPAMFNGPWSIFVGLANITGKHAVSINLVHDDTTTVVLPFGFEIEVPQQQQTNSIELNLPCPPVLFANKGSYTLTVNIDGQQVGCKTLQVSILQQSGV